jgi:hypothetical protein
VEQQDLVGLTVSDGFKFGCGFSLALIIGFLATLLVFTAFVVVGALLGVKFPLAG